MTLHTINKSPQQSTALADCLALAANTGHGILLLEDGVYAARDTAANRALWNACTADIRIYVLDTDLAARGISAKILPRMEAVSYTRFVSLCLEYSKVISWT